MDEVLRVEDLSFSFRQRPILHSIDLSVKKGQLVAISGPNGSGKSTLLKILDGIYKPSSGQVYIWGKSIERLKRREISRLVAMVGQENHFSFSFTALEVVLMGRFPHLAGFQIEGQRDMAIVQNAMELTNTIGFAQRSINELSGGEKQRVLIARALAQGPGLLLLDEPTSFLDPRYKMEIFALISKVVREKGMASIVVSHDLDLASQYCHELVLLKDGEVLAKGRPEHVLCPENIKALYGCDSIVDKNPKTMTLRVTLIPGS